MVKGFAFVEFDKPEFASNALKALVVEKSRLRPDMDPAELQSVKTFVAEQEQQIVEKEVIQVIIIINKKTLTQLKDKLCQKSWKKRDSLVTKETLWYLFKFLCT